MRLRVIQTSATAVVIEGPAREIIITEDIVIVIDSDSEMTVLNFSASEDATAKPIVMISENASALKIFADVPAIIGGDGIVSQVEANASGVEIGTELGLTAAEIKTSPPVVSGDRGQTTVDFTDELAKFSDVSFDDSARKSDPLGLSFRRPFPCCFAPSEGVPRHVHSVRKYPI